MGPINKTIENDLIKLKHFSEQEKLVGYVNHLWFYGLRTKYPLEYLFYSQDNSKQTYFKNEAKESIIRSLNRELTHILNKRLTQEIHDELKNILVKARDLSKGNLSQ